jgi:hypothetical protein
MFPILSIRFFAIEISSSVSPGLLGVAVHYEAPIEPVTLRIGGRAAAGAGWTRGDAADARVREGGGAGAIVLVSAVLGLEIAVAEWLALVASFDAGAVPLGFDALADGVVVASISGVALGGWAGLAFRL